MRRGFVLGLLLVSIGTSAGAQGAAPAPSKAAEVLLSAISTAEKQITGIATAMPADKYGFAPNQGAFTGVRDFAAQIKHAAAEQLLLATTILNEPVTADMSNERGPDSVRTKEEVLRYLRESFATLKRAASTTTVENAFASIKGPSDSPATRVGLIMGAVTHTTNHYGQIVEYLRMNGLTPPR